MKLDLNLWITLGVGTFAAMKLLPLLPNLIATPASPPGIVPTPNPVSQPQSYVYDPKLQPPSGYASPPGIFTAAITPATSGRVIVTWPATRSITNFSYLKATLTRLGIALPAGDVLAMDSFTITVPVGRESEVAAALTATGKMSASPDRIRTAS